MIKEETRRNIHEKLHGECWHEKTNKVCIGTICKQDDDFYIIAVADPIVIDYEIKSRVQLTCLATGRQRLNEVVVENMSRLSEEEQDELFVPVTSDTPFEIVTEEILIGKKFANPQLDTPAQRWAYMGKCIDKLKEKDRLRHSDSFVTYCYQIMIGDIVSVFTDPDLFLTTLDEYLREGE